jgi:hypothetical protein
MANSSLSLRMESMYNHPTLDWKWSHLRESWPPWEALGQESVPHSAKPRQRPYKLLRILVRVCAYSRLGSVIRYVEVMEEHFQ